ncbi:MAG TPA: hypothetical protein VFR73_12500 [Hyphomicrobiaceae bacterium]|nr:hypothetical protein [Hyphomicrobiaceae bacterium]
MRMSEEKSRRLMAMVWRERAKRWALIALVPAVLFAGATYMLSGQLSRADRTIEVARHTGTVTGIARSGPRSSIAHVHLDDGRDVEALSQMSIIPPAGSHVVVSESRHASGRLSYDLKGLSE